MQTDRSEGRTPGQRTMLRIGIFVVVEIDIENLLAIPNGGQLARHNRDLQLVPFALRLGHVSRRGRSAVERAGGMHINWLAGVAEDLQLHAGESRITGWAGSQKDAAVALRAGAIFEA